MADESIVIEIKDGIDNSIASKLRGIATEARGAQTILNGLQKAVNNLKTSGANSVSTQAATASAALNKLATSNANLATAQQKTAAASASASAALQKLATEQQKTAAAAAKLATETARTAAAQAQATLAADRLAASQARAQARVQSQALANANAATAAAKLAPLLDKNAAATNKAGISTKQYNAAMRGVPAQITDIIVSLQGGQKPLTVLLQQGGQLKDMFGGIGPAAKALTTGLIAMINPLTLAAAAMAALVIAAFKVESSMRTVNGLVAQFAATGRGSMDGSAISELRKELALLPGVSKSAATEVIQEFANIRDIGGTNLKAAAGTVADLGAALGVDAPAAAKKLAEALYDPIKGSQDLDKALGFLTIGNFKAIKRMSELGDTAGAQALIIRRLKEEYSGLADKSLTPLQRATNNLGNAWNKFTGELTNSGAIKNVLDGLTGLVNIMTMLITKLDAISNMKPPGWLSDLKDNPATSWLWTMGNNSDSAKKAGGASGSWEAPKGSQFQQTTAFKTDAAGITGKKDKSGETRAAALAKINAQLSNEIKLMGMLGPEREKQEMFDRIQERLLGRKIKLTQAETATIKEKIAAIVENRAVQEETNRIYEEAIEPLRTYNAVTQATADLLQRGAISEAESNKQNLIAFERYANIVDPLRAYNTELDQSFKLSKMTADQHEIESALISLQNDLLTRGITLRGDEIQVLRERLELNQTTTKAQQAYNQIYEQTTGAVKQIAVETAALTRAQQEGLISAEQYQLRLVALGVAASNVKLGSGNGDMTDVAIASLGRLVQAYEGVLPGLSKSFGDFFTTLEDGFANSIGRAVVYSENLGDALRNVAQDALSSLIGALVKLGIQYVVNAALGNTLAATSTATGAALAAASAAAWAPAAALASLASFGANAAPAMAGIASTVGLASTLASVGKLAGFESGGYTGNGGTSQVAGVVHGKEFVMDAAATNRIGVGNLEALQSGAMSLNANSSTVGKSSSSNSAGMKVVVENHGTPQTYEPVPTMNEGEYRLIAMDVVNKKTDEAVARAMANPNSYTRKSMATNTNVTRK